VAKSLFNKNISPACAYCVHGHISEYTNEVFCLKRGVTEPTDSCRKFKYDPCKRIPAKARALDFSRYNEEDFSL